MKKLLFSASALVLGMCFASEAMADCNGLYLAGRGGITKHDYSSSSTSGLNTDGLDKNKLMLSGAMGYRLDYWRTEAEYVWRDKSEQKFDNIASYNFKSYSMMWNNYYDFAPYSVFSPYVGVGLGFTKMKYSDKDLVGVRPSIQYKETNFTWSVGGGATLKVTSKFNVDAGYRYYDMGSMEHADITDHEFYTGVRYVF